MGEPRRERIIVGFRDGVDEDQRAGVHSGMTGRGLTRTPRALAQVGPRAEVVEIVGDSLESALDKYARDQRVAYVEPDYPKYALETPNDPYFGYQWDMTRIQAPTGWNSTHGSAGVRVAVLDTGVDISHPDLAGKVALQKDFTGAGNAADRAGHGTHVAGTIAAATNNAVGVAGVGYDTTLISGKVLNDSGSGYDSWIANGIYWATDNGAKVISMSLGGSGPVSTTMQNAIDYAWSRNVVVVAAAGNSGSTSKTSPASANHVVSVASTGSSDAKSSFSNYGTWVTVAAPGESILSTGIGGGYRYMSGTSMATPHVSGLAALVYSTSHGSSAQSVINRITSTADKISGTGSYWQSGRINVAAAVGGSSPSTAIPTTVPTSLPTAQPTAVPTVAPTNTPTKVPATQPTVAPTNTSVPTAIPTKTPTPSAGPTLSASPSSVATGGTVTVSWSGIASPSAYDWIGLYRVGAADSSYLDWVRVSGTKTASIPRVSGTATFKMPTTAGNYEFRLFSNSSWTRLAVSNQVTVGAAPTAVPTNTTQPQPTATPLPGGSVLGAAMSAYPAAVAPGATVTVSFSGISSPNAADWIGIYRSGSSDTVYTDWVYTNGSKTSGSGVSSGKFTISLPSTTGNYDLRLFSNNGYNRLAVSNPITVSASAPSGTVPTYRATPSAADLSAVQAALGFINQSRAQYGLPAVTLYEPLRQQAQAFADDLSTRNYFSHYTPEGLGPGERMAAAGISSTYWAENVGYGYGYGNPTASVQQNHNAMMAEVAPNDGHKKNILSSYAKRVGIGVVTGNDGRTYYVTDFMN